ncbi:hypothetical protein DNTS_016479 [Danionella cerebrum]|uniref:PH domain-containing protein n=1 Tax=Danionella cerebrum TaxID=2873325 RepID=A0A553QTL4_9TELE|nr:hypothetical protein DNTS_016479 [Danionella translucida]
MAVHCRFPSTLIELERQRGLLDRGAACVGGSLCRGGLSCFCVMDLKSELLKSIWYAFTSLDVEQSGKVSKSQLKVLSHNLYTALNIPHDPVALEEHFKDNNIGPVSNHGYMPYLNKYILAKATEGTFNKEIFDELCWTMTSKKNCKAAIQQGLCSARDCFKLFCLFNLLSEDRYPLVIIQPELPAVHLYCASLNSLEYLLKKICSAMALEWDGTLVEELVSQNAGFQDGLSVWEFLEHLSAGQLLHVESKESFSLAVEEVFLEMYHNILKKGYLLKKGHVRRNWQERWFVLKPGVLTYYAAEDLKEKKGEILLEDSIVVDSVPDREGKRCLFCVKTPAKTFEMSASNLKHRVDWTQAIQTGYRLRAEGKSSLHQELRVSRRKQRETLQRSQSNQSSNSDSGATEAMPPEQQGETESLEQHIESIIQVLLRVGIFSSSRPHYHRGLQQVPVGGWMCMCSCEDEDQQSLMPWFSTKQREVEAKRKEEEKEERQKQQDTQRDLERQLHEAEEEKERIRAALNEMEKEVLQHKTRIRELELTQVKLEEALNAQIHARLEEDRVRQELESQLAEEQRKIAELLLLQKQLETSVGVQEEPQHRDETSVLSQELDQSSEDTEAPVDEASSTTYLSIQAEERCQQSAEREAVNQSTSTQMLKQWKVQLNRLMKPINPADKVEHLPIKLACPRQGQALTSTEFISKVQTVTAHEKGNGYSPSPPDEQEE